jgi:hypothetical protein
MWWSAEKTEGTGTEKTEGTDFTQSSGAAEKIFSSLFSSVASMFCAAVKRLAY